MKKNFLAFDFGASSGRAIVGTLDAGRLQLQEVHRFPNGPIERDGELFWDYPGLCNEIETGIAKALAVSGDLAAIAIDTWGVDYVLFRQGQMVRLPYNYRDERTNKVMNEVQNLAGSKSQLYARTGIQCMSFNTIYQLYAQQKDHPEDFKDAQFLPMPDALLYAIGGDFSAEYTDCSTTELIDPVSREWNWALIDDLRLPRSIFPKIVPPCSKGGTLSKTLQAKFNCGAIPIYKVGSHDTASAVAAVPAQANTNWAYLSCGTWALLGTELPQVKISPETEAAPFTNEGGLNRTIRFLTNIMGCWLIQQTRDYWKSQGHNYSFDDLAAMADQAEPFRFLIDPNAADFLAPGDLPVRIKNYCRATGQGEITGDAQILRCIYDSLALYFADKLAALEQLLGVKYAAFNIVGGGTKDELLMQFAADAIGIPVIAGPVEATAIGNLIAQAITAGDLADLDEARKVVRESFAVKTFAVNATKHRQFVQMQDKFRQILNFKF